MMMMMEQHSLKAAKAVLKLYEFMLYEFMQVLLGAGRLAGNRQALGV
jgi:hypothetical protein